MDFSQSLDQMMSSFGMDTYTFAANDSVEIELIDDNFANQFLNPIPSDEETHPKTFTAEAPFAGLPEIKHEERWITVDQYNASLAPLSPVASSIDDHSPKNTQELLSEFNAVYNAYESNLTPPQSPPQESKIVVLPPPPTSSSSIIEDSEIFCILEGEEVDPELLFNNDDSLDSEQSNDFFDELVRSHSSSIPDDLSSLQSSSSPRSDISTSPRSDTSFDVSGYEIDDDEWSPAIIEPAVAAAKRKKRPYGRPVEEKKVRKKEQNKNAATRYRQKKKQQLDVILREEEQLKAIHMQLKTKFDDRKREINYLKKLMKEILIAKGFQI